MKNKVLLITGGTGSLGQYLVKKALQLKFKKIIIFSRHEDLQVRMKRDFNHESIRYFIGDIRDKRRLVTALNGVDYVIHTAALKHVDVCHYNPIEVIKTNVYGAENLIETSLLCGVEKVLSVSTDKACLPVNIYGGCKFVSDILFVMSNVYSGIDGPKFSCVRFGNFENSRGSVVEYFEELKVKDVKIFPITDVRMSRYFLTLSDAADFCFEFLDCMKGGEIFVPKMEEKNIVDVAFDISSDIAIQQFGRKRGEKIKEDLIAECEEGFTEEFEDYWVTNYKEK